MLSPFFFLATSTVGMMELSGNLLIKKNPKPDPVYGFLREIISIVLFYGVPSIVLYSMTHDTHIMELVLTITSAIVLLISLLIAYDKCDGHLIFPAICALVLGFFVSEYAILIGVLLSIVLRLWRIRLIDREKIAAIWDKMDTLRIPYILMILDFLATILILRGYI